MRRGAPRALGRLRAGLDLIIDLRGADMADLPGGASRMLVRGYRVLDAALTPMAVNRHIHQIHQGQNEMRHFPSGRPDWLFHS